MGPLKGLVWVSRLHACTPASPILLRGPAAAAATAAAPAAAPAAASSASVSVSSHSGTSIAAAVTPTVAAAAAAAASAASMSPCPLPPPLLLRSAAPLRTFAFSDALPALWTAADSTAAAAAAAATAGGHQQSPLSTASPFPFASALPLAVCGALQPPALRHGLHAARAFASASASSNSSSSSIAHCNSSSRGECGSSQASVETARPSCQARQQQQQQQQQQQWQQQQQQLLQQQQRNKGAIGGMHPPFNLPPARSMSVVSRRGGRRRLVWSSTLPSLFPHLPHLPHPQPSHLLRIVQRPDTPPIFPHLRHMTTTPPPQPPGPPSQPQTQQGHQQQQGKKQEEEEEDWRRRWQQRTAAASRAQLMYLAAMVVGMLGLSYAAVPLYRMFCQATGFGGTTQRKETVEQKVARQKDANKGDSHTSDQPSAAARRELVVHFNADVADNLPWKFTPCQNEVRVRPGQSTLAFYTAHNRSSEPITGVSTYNVSPMKAGVYFNKIQCFCFEEQRLQAGEKIDMPVFFYVDEEFATDPNMWDVNNLTLSYTFFRVDK